MGLNGSADGTYRRSVSRTASMPWYMAVRVSLTKQARVVVHVADLECHRGVTVDTVEEHGDVDVDDVAVGQRSAVGNAVADDLVDRRTHRLGIAPVVERAGIGPPAHDLVVNLGVDAVGGHPWGHQLPSEQQHLSGHLPRSAHGLDLLAAAN